MLIKFGTAWAQMKDKLHFTAKIVINAGKADNKSYE